MKAKLLVQILAITCLLTTTSCVSFIERVFFRANGSGTYSFSVDMNSMIEMASMMGEEMDTDSLMSELNMDESGTMAKLEAIEGLSNVRPHFDKETNILSMNFDFDNIKALNEGISTYLHDSTQTEVVQYQFFTLKGKTIERNNQNLLMDTFQKSMTQGASEDDEMSMEFVKMMFSDMYYAVEIGAEEGIKSFKNDEYERKDENTITWKTYPFSEAGKKNDISVTIKKK